MANLFVRPYQATDYEAVWHLHVAALLPLNAYAGDGAWDDDLRMIETIYHRDRHCFLVGLYEGNLVAMGALRTTTPDRAEICRMRVHPDVQGRGFGKQMLHALEAQARAFGYAVLHLQTSDRQIAAQALYRQQGYQETGQRIWQGLTCLLLEKHLPAS